MVSVTCYQITNGSEERRFLTVGRLESAGPWGSGLVRGGISDLISAWLNKLTSHAV